MQTKKCLKCLGDMPSELVEEYCVACRMQGTMIALNKERHDSEKTIHYTTDKQGNQKTYKILNHPIKELPSQALIDDKVYVVTYFPTEIKTEKKTSSVRNETITEIDWANSAYYIIRDNKETIGNQKKILPYDDSTLNERYKVKVLSQWPEAGDRWQHELFIEWYDSIERTKPIDLITLLDDTIPKYIEFGTQETYIVFYLWLLGTYFFRLFPTFPYLDFTGTKRVGKTKVLEIINLVAFNATIAGDVTGPTLFRLIELRGGTLCIDEIEQIKNQKSEQYQQVRTLLLQGFKRNQYAYRSQGKEQNFSPVPFNLYCPKAFGHINEFDDVLEDRCISIIMQRSINKSVQNTHPRDHDKVWSSIRNLCYRMFLDYAPMIDELRKRADEIVPVSGRERELWLPIITMALLLESQGGCNVLAKVIKYATESSDTRQGIDEQENPDYKLIPYLEDLITNNSTISSKPSDLWDDFKRKAEPFGFNLKFYSERKFFSALHRLGIDTRRTKTKRYYDITPQIVLKIKERLNMIPDEKTASPSVTHEQITSDGNQEVVTLGDGHLPSPKSSEIGQNRHEGDANDAGDGKNQEIHTQVTLMTEHQNNEQRHLPSPSPPEAEAISINIKQKMNFRCADCNAGPWPDDNSMISKKCLAFHKDHSLVWEEQK